MLIMFLSSTMKVIPVQITNVTRSPGAVTPSLSVTITVASRHIAKITKYAEKLASKPVV